MSSSLLGLANDKGPFFAGGRAMRREVGAAMREVEVAVTADDGRAIAGTLALPEGPGPHPAAVLLWPGRLDREGSVRKASLGLGRAMARALADKGVASYRFDRRGVGATGGDFRATGFYQHRQDAAAVLRAVAARDDVGAVGVIGYSEGALHAAWLGGHAAPPCTAVVLLGCPAQAGEEFYLSWASRLGKEQVPWYLKVMLRPLGRTPRDQVARVCRKIKATRGDVARVYGFKVAARMCREFLAYDPKPDLAAIRVPVLAITGSNDFSIGQGDLEVIARLVPGEVETRCIKDLTHLLRRDPRPASAKSYREQYQQPVDAELPAEVATWVAAHLQPQPARSSSPRRPAHQRKIVTGAMFCPRSVRGAGPARDLRFRRRCFLAATPEGKRTMSAPDLPDVQDPRSPLGRAMRECEVYCEAPCCGMDAYDVSLEQMRQWADRATASDVEVATRQVEEALAALRSAPETFFFLDCDHTRADVMRWFEQILAVLAELRAGH
jgi:pimeloyl-ACP methyl ester carboxylesterase